MSDHEQQQGGDEEPLQDGQELGGGWIAYRDDEGRFYYYSGETGETQWERPEEAVALGQATPRDEGERAGGDRRPAYDYQNDAETPDTVTPVRSPLDDIAGSESASPGDGPGGSKEGAGGGDAAADGGTDGITKSPPLEQNVGGIPQSPAAETMEGISPRDKPDERQDEPMAEETVAEQSEEELHDGQELGDGWVAYKDDEGRFYYYNGESGETQWERPEIAPKAVVETAGGDVANKEVKVEPVSEAREAQTQETQSEEAAAAEQKAAMPSKAPAEPQEEEEKPAEVDITPEQFLAQPDAIMEPGVLDRIDDLVRDQGAGSALPFAAKTLAAGYGGDTSVCGLLGLWLAELTAMKGGPDGAPSAANGQTIGAARPGRSGRLFDEGADRARDAAEGVIGRLVKERFKDGDSIMRLSKKQVAFVDGMIGSPRWRKLLIDLSATNKDSTFFMYCLTTISNLGHHREIASRINQSDYFGVFHSMLQSELTIAGRAAVDGCDGDVLGAVDGGASKGGGGGGGGGGMGAFVADLRRTCTSTSYPYLYAMEVLHDLIERAESSGDASLLRPAVRKWKRLREELEEGMLVPAGGSGNSTFQRKRRTDVALTLSDLFQRKRRRVAPTATAEGNGSNGNGGHNDLADSLDEALIHLLSRNGSLGYPIDKDSADAILKYAYGGSTDRIGDLLIRHPVSVNALLRNLFGVKRVRQLDVRLKCARLVSLAVIAAERGANGTDGVDISLNDEDQLTQTVLACSQLCEQVENMVSFAVLDSSDDGEGDSAPGVPSSSVGRRLSSHCVRHAVIARGALLWASELASGPEFAETASYPTLSPCILSLARVISRHHPMTRPAVLDLALLFASHSNRDVGHKKMASIKEQCVRLLLCLSAEGHSVEVLRAVRGRLEGDAASGGGGGATMDSALVRYLFSGLLELVRPPFSLSFVRALGGLMMTRAVVEALQSAHFEASKRHMIIQLVRNFEGTCEAQRRDGGVGCEGDGVLIAALKRTYCPSM